VPQIDYFQKWTSYQFFINSSWYSSRCV